MKKLLLITLFISCSMVEAQASSYYYGLDFKYRNMRPDDKDSYYLSKTFGRDYEAWNLYAIARYYDDVGIGLTLEESGAVEKRHIFTNGEQFLGDPQASGDQSVITSRLHALYIDVSGFLTLKDKFEFLGIIGLGIMRVTIKGTIFVGGTAFDMQPVSRYKIIPKVNAGIQYLFTQKVGARVLVGWEATKLLTNSFSDEDGIRHRISPFKSSYTTSIGVFAKI